MKKLIILAGILPFLASCQEEKEYNYADQAIELYEESIEEMEEAEDMEKVEEVSSNLQKQLKQLEEEQKESHQALIHDMESMEETAYLRHLDLLYQESHIQWLYAKKKFDFQKKKE